MVVKRSRLNRSRRCTIIRSSPRRRILSKTSPRRRISRTHRNRCALRTRAKKMTSKVQRRGQMIPDMVGRHRMGGGTLIEYIKQCSRFAEIASPVIVSSYIRNNYEGARTSPASDLIFNTPTARCLERKCGSNWIPWNSKICARGNDEHTDYCLSGTTDPRTCAMILWNRIASESRPYIHPLILNTYKHTHEPTTNITPLVDPRLHIDLSIDILSMQHFDIGMVFPKKMPNNYLWIFDLYTDETYYHTFSIVSYSGTIYLVHAVEDRCTIGHWLANKPIPLKKNTVLTTLCETYPCGVISNTLDYNEYTNCLIHMRSLYDSRRIRLSAWSHIHIFDPPPTSLPLPVEKTPNQETPSQRNKRHDQEYQDHINDMSYMNSSYMYNSVDG